MEIQFQGDSSILARWNSGDRRRLVGRFVAVLSAFVSECGATVAKFRQAQQSLVAEIRNIGFLPEGEIHGRSRGSSPYDMGHDAVPYPLERVIETAELASLLEGDARPR